MGAAARAGRSRWAGAAAVPLESPSMRVRALIVVLVALNLGVAAWWLTRPSTAPRPLPASDKGGVALVLLPAQVATASPATASGNGGVGPQAAGPAPATCLSVGPFPDRGAAEVAQAGLGTLLREAEIREEPGAASGYRVLLPPAASRAEAQATADRIAAAGFQDFLLLNQGEDANGIALGAYRGRETAERRVAALRAAGFPAQLRAQGAAGPSRWWLDGASADADAVRATFPAAQERDCATLPGGTLR